MVWTQQAGMRDLSNGTIVGTARAISSSAQWIVGGDNTTGDAFRYNFVEAGTPEHIGVLPGRTSAIPVSATYEGRRIYATCDGGAGQVACLWEEGAGWATVADRLAAQGISTAGWTLLVVLAASSNGATSVGYGINPSGQTQAWAAVIELPRGECNSCCPDVDFNCDGDLGTDADIEAFFACLAGNCPPPPCCHGSADINRDGDVARTTPTSKPFSASLCGRPAAEPSPGRWAFFGGSPMSRSILACMLAFVPSTVGTDADIGVPVGRLLTATPSECPHEHCWLKINMSPPTCRLASPAERIWARRSGAARSGGLAALGARGVGGEAAALVTATLATADRMGSRSQAQADRPRPG